MEFNQFWVWSWIYLLLSTQAMGFLNGHEVEAYRNSSLTDGSRQNTRQDYFYNLFQMKHPSIKLKKSYFNPLNLQRLLPKLGRQDYLHAYPNAEDIKVHSIFQQISLFEINNADKVRQAITALKVLFIMKVIVLSLVFGVSIFGALFSVLPFGRRSLSKTSVNWDRIETLSSFVLKEIEKARSRYESESI